MNFIKSTWTSIFQKQSASPQPAGEKKEESNQQQIPIDVLEKLFKMSADCMKESDAKVQNSDKLLVYGFYKQATHGDCDVPKPQMFDFVGKAKWESWHSMRGMTKAEAMSNYICKANEIDPNISNKIEKELCPDENTEVQGTGFKKVEQQDFSDEYSHPYFKAIQRGEDIPDIQHELLLIKNNSPEVYPLHFAIDKEQEELVEKFLAMLSVEQITSMVDSEGTGIQEYAELIENEAILAMVGDKLKSS